jgi:uncharacterized protein YprB with RNaseH-like and TPR domain
MKDLADRLRGIIAAVPAAAQRTPSSSPLSSDPRENKTGSDAADVLGGQWLDTAGQRVLVVDRVYRPGHRHGRLALVDHVLPECGSWLPAFLPEVAGRTTRPEGSEAPRTVFVDLETSGLAGGAGTYAFLVGCAWFEHCSFRVRQLFMTSAAAEPAMLAALTDLASAVDLVVSFNGKSFDLPLIDTRYVIHRRSSPFSEVPHLDMLHLARRLWRRESDEADESGRGRCSLTALESIVCGHTREGDVPGFEIPSRYFHFVRTGDATPLAAVFEHNRLDLLSLAFLTSRAAQLAADEVPQPTTAREALGLAQLLERAGDMVRARRCFARAAAVDDQSPLPGDESTRAEAMHAYANLCRRDRRYTEAASAWRQLLDLRRCPPGLARSASEALAIHHEHRVRDLKAARSFALRSAGLQNTVTRRQALEHRLARIDRKLVSQPLTLF